MSNLLILQSEYVAGIPNDFDGYVETGSIASCVVVCALQRNNTYVFAHILSAGWWQTKSKDLMQTQQENTTWALLNKWTEEQKGWFYFNSSIKPIEQNSEHIKNLKEFLRERKLKEESANSPNCIGKVGNYLNSGEINVPPDWNQNNLRRKQIAISVDGKVMLEMSFEKAKVDIGQIHNNSL